jgi:hypothetical protein
MADQDPQEEPQRVPVRRMRGAGAVDVFIGSDAYQVNEGDILEAGVWPWEVTPEHGWERVTKKEARQSARAAKEEADQQAEALQEAVMAEQQAAGVATEPTSEGGDS